jgi:CBS domain-containing protein
MAATVCVFIQLNDRRSDRVREKLSFHPVKDDNKTKRFGISNLFMKVHEVMTTDVGVCGPEDDLTRAAQIMWQKDCGVVPVVDAEKRLVGMLTDRDIAIACASRRQSPHEIRAREMYLREPFTCAAGDEIKDVLRRMRKRKVRRLPVVDDDKALVGIVSVSDILLKGADKKSVRKLAFSTLKSIAKPAPIVLREEPEKAEEAAG